MNTLKTSDINRYQPTITQDYRLSLWLKTKKANTTTDQTATGHTDTELTYYLLVPMNPSLVDLGFLY